MVVETCAFLNRILVIPVIKMMDQKLLAFLMRITVQLDSKIMGLAICVFPKIKPVLTVTRMMEDKIFYASNSLIYVMKDLKIMDLVIFASLKIKAVQLDIKMTVEKL